MPLPDSVLAEADHEIQGEDAALDILRKRLPGLRFQTLVTEQTPPPFVLLRTTTYLSTFSSDERFVWDFFLTAESFTDGVDADIEGPMIHQAIQRALTKSAYANDPVLDGAGWVVQARLIEPARRKSDWANSQGPVQQAELPQGYARFESIFRIKIKRADVGPHAYSH